MFTTLMRLAHDMRSMDMYTFINNTFPLNAVTQDMKMEEKSGKKYEKAEVERER